MAKPKKPPSAGQYHLGGVVLLRRAIRNRRGQELPEGACVLIIEVKDERRRVERRDGVRVVCDVKDLRPLTDERSGVKDD